MRSARRKCREARRRTPGEFGVGAPFDHVAHQRFRHADVDVVHRHVVAVESAPAQCQLGEIAGADHESAKLVGQVHQDLRAFAGLRIFIRDIEQVFVVVDILKMLLDRVVNPNDPELGASGLHQLFGIGAGALAGAEAGHGDGDNSFAIEPQ